MESVIKQINRPKFTKITHGYPISLPITTEVDSQDVLAITASVSLKSLQTTLSTAKVSALAVFNVVHREEGELNSFESGTDLSYDIINERITAGDPVCVRLYAGEEKVKKSESGLELTAVIYAEIYFCDKDAVEFLEDIQGAVVKQEKLNLLNVLSGLNDTVEVDGEKTFPYFIEKVLCHKSHARVISIAPTANSFDVEGEIYTEFLFLTKSGERINESALTPFRVGVDCDKVSYDNLIFALASISSANFKISSEEEAQSSQIVGEYTLSFKGVIFEKTAVNCVIDGFSTTNELELENNLLPFCVGVYEKTFKHKCFGEGDTAFENGAKVYATLTENSEITNYAYENGLLNISGVVSAHVITKTQSKGLSGERVQLPFECSFEVGDAVQVLTCYPRGLAVRNLDGKCIIECELVFSALLTQSESSLIATSVVIGEEKTAKSPAISVVFVNKGDDLWSVCKKAQASEKSVLANNPDLAFPVPQDKAIVVYRKIQ